MSKWLLSLSLLTIVGSAGVTFVDHMESRLVQLESADLDKPDRVLQLTQQIAALNEDLTASQARMSCYESERVQGEMLLARIAELETKLADARNALNLQAVEIAGVGEMQDVILRETLGEQLEDLNQNIEERWKNVSQTLEATAQIAESNRNTFNGLVRDLQQSKRKAYDADSMWSELMGPTVQISDESTVGSGVLLQSREIQDGKFRTHLLTAWHVIRDIMDDPTNLQQPVPTNVFRQNGQHEQHFAALVAYDAKIDIALLVMNSDVAFAHGADLPSRASLAERRVFDEIYAVGCPLGNNPIPTRGEIADTHHTVDGEKYWMISAPTYIGNSGGGIFKAETHELLGIFSKIYTHGNLRPTVVPHMGLVTPLSIVYDWLESSGNGALVPK